MNRKIKVAHVISRMVSGGAEENTAYTVLGLDKSKYEIDIIVGDDFNEDILGNNKNTKEINVIQLRGLKGTLKVFYDLIILYKLIKLFDKNQYDIIHTHATKTGILGRIAAKIAGVPIIICGLHGSAFQAFNSKILNWILIYLEKLTGNFTDAYISVSKILSEKYKQEGIGTKSEYFTVLSGMDLSKFHNARNKFQKDDILQEFNLDSNAFIVGNVGRLEKVKGHKYLLDSFKIVKNKIKNNEMFLLLVGEGEERANLEKYVKRIGLENSIIFTGYRKDIERIMLIMDIFVLSSLREGLPRVLVQASALGIPSVAFNVDGVPEIIKDKYNGFLVEPKNTNELADRIINYINDKALMKSHGENGIKFVSGKWSIETMVKQTDDIYKKYIEKKIR